MVGRSVRTVRRWENQEKRSPTARGPVRPLRDVEPVLTREANRERRRIVQHNERLAHGRQPVPRDLPVLPVGERRTLRNYKAGKWDGTYRESSWVNYDVHGLENETLLAMLREYMGEDLYVQFIFRTPDLSGAGTGRMVLDTRGNVLFYRAASAPEYFGDVDEDDQIQEMLDNNFNVPGHTALYIAVHDSGDVKRSNVQERKRKRRRKRK